jgi:hypothetical protein
MNNNNLIERFMGIERIVDTPKKYHSKWDWLIPVIGKVRKVELNNHHRNAYAHMAKALVNECHRDLDLDGTYDAVIYFIEIYNIHK